MSECVFASRQDCTQMYHRQLCQERLYVSCGAIHVVITMHERSFPYSSDAIIKVASRVTPP